MGGLDPDFTNIMIVVMVVMSVIIVIVNGGCIYIISTSKLLREKTASILVYSILLLHLLQGCFVIPFYTAKKARVTNDLSKRIICDGFRFSYMITFYAACVNVLLIGGDRLLAVRLLTSYKRIVTRRRVTIVTISLWMYVFVLCLIPFIPTEKKSRYCTYNQQNWWTIMMLFTNTLVPYIVVIISYGYIFKKLDKMAEKQRTHSSAATIMSDVEPLPQKKRSRGVSTFSLFKSRNSVKKSETDMDKNKSIRKITQLTFMIILTYGLTWAPSIIYYILLKVAPSIFTEEYNTSAEESYVTFFIKFITFFDAIFTPVIYCYFHHDFKKEFKKFWMKNIKREDISTAGTSSSTDTL